jgi:hypothetical protein
MIKVPRMAKVNIRASLFTWLLLIVLRGATSQGIPCQETRKEL